MVADMHDSQPQGHVWNSLAESETYLRKRLPGLAPQVGVVLGSGLGAFADTLKSLSKIPYGEIPNFADSTVAGHSGNLCFGKTANGVDVVCMQGRVHSYEGHSVERVVHGVRTMAKLGVGTVLLTNAAGGLEPSWLPGDLMVIEDHLNLTGVSPLTGANEERLGPRFPDMTRAYDKELNAQLADVAREHGIALRKGIYAGLPGPSYETPAEVRMLRAFGAHAVGMSTVLEVLALRHMKIRVGALSCITNLAAGILDRELDHAEVEAAAKAKRAALLTLLEGWIARAGVSS
jgi:purine-nucleoside phosphorylase